MQYIVIKIVHMLRIGKVAEQIFVMKIQSAD
jgi:hypothetical protein